MENNLSVGERFGLLFNKEKAERENLLSVMRRLSQLKVWLESRSAKGVTTLCLGSYVMVYWTEGPSLLEARVEFKYLQRPCDFFKS